MNNQQQTKQSTTPNTSLLRHILEGIANGDLDHNQSYYHCGTSHCIAGWVEVFEAERMGMAYGWSEERSGSPSFFFNDTFTLNNFRQYDPLYLEPDKNLASPWLYARSKLGLNEIESDILFDVFASFTQQCALLQLLESGDRLLTVEDIRRFMNLEPDNGHSKQDIFARYCGN